MQPITNWFLAGSSIVWFKPIRLTIDVNYWLRILSKAFNNNINKWVNIDQWIRKHNINIRNCCSSGNIEDSRCLCCKVLNCSPVFKSNVTGKLFIFSKEGNFNCKSKNLIYLITCSDCGVQYVGQTIQPIHLRLNAHRSCVNRNTNTFIYNHFNSNGHNFANASIQIIDCLDSTCITDLDTLENYWIATLCTAYPLGLNDRVDGVGNISKSNVDNTNCYFTKPIIRRRRGHGRRRRDKRVDRVLVDITNNSLNETIINNEILTLNELFNNNMKLFYNKLRSLSKRLLKAIVLKVTSDHLFISPILQSFFHNLYGPKGTVNKVIEKECIIIPFNCKFIDTLSVNSILRDSNVASLLPEPFKDKLPLKVFYKYNAPISRRLLNYNAFLKELTTDEIKDIISKECSCSSSDYIYAPHNHIVTGNLNVISNSRLRILMSFGAKYREPIAMEPADIKSTIYSYIDRFILSKANKYRINADCFKLWEKKVKDIISNRIDFFVKHKPEIFSNGTSIWHNKEISDFIEEFHKKFIVVVADKASNNFVVICKKFYTLVLMNELGVDANSLSCVGNTTYSFVTHNKHEIINKTIKELKDNFNIDCPMEDLHIPTIFWNPKLHKIPYKARFIAGARRCVTKELAIKINKGMQVLKSSFIKYCKSVLQRTGINFNWSIHSSIEFLDRIKAMEIWSLQVYDFSTLYTNLNLNDVEDSLFGLCNLLFSPRSKFICINTYKAFFSIKKYNNFSCFDINLFKKAISFILNNTYVSFGSFVLKQTKGIPMGGSCSSPIADLYLSFKEFSFMKKLLKEKKFHLAKLLSNNNRYVDDIIIINYKTFNNRANEIYPVDLLLERNGDDEKNVSYLDVKIEIFDDEVITSLYNKVDDFDFTVVTFTFPDSNIPIQLGYNVFFGQVLRYAKIYSRRQDFIKKAAELLQIFTVRGYKHHILFKRFKRLLYKYNFILYKFGYKDSDEAVEEFHHYYTTTI